MAISNSSTQSATVCTPTATVFTSPNIEKSIRYDRETGDYRCTLTAGDEVLSVGYASTYSAGETWCAAEYYRLIEDGQIATEYDLTPEEAAEIAPTGETLCRDGDSLAFGYEVGSLLGQLVHRIDAMERPQAARFVAFLTALVAPVSAVRSEQAICNDRLNPEMFGKSYGTQYLCGDGAEEVELFFDANGNAPEVFMFGREGIPLAEVERVLPKLLTLLFSPQVQQACKAVAQ